MYKFTVPLHPKNLAQLIHPFYGYLANMQNYGVTFKDLYTVYLNQIASSYEKTYGREILGEELCCLHFWNLHDSDQKGWMTLKEAGVLLRAFKFDQLFLNEKGHLVQEDLTLKRLKEEFKFTLSQRSAELIQTEDPNDTIIRFDLVREIFLERGL